MVVGTYHILHSHMKRTSKRCGGVPRQKRDARPDRGVWRNTRRALNRRTLARFLRKLQHCCGGIPSDPRTDCHWLFLKVKHQRLVAAARQPANLSSSSREDSTVPHNFRDGDGGAHTLPIPTRRLPTRPTPRRRSHSTHSRFGTREWTPDGQVLKLETDRRQRRLTWID